MTRTKSQKLRALQSRLSKSGNPSNKPGNSKQGSGKRSSNRRGNRNPKSSNSNMGIVGVPAQSSNLSTYFRTLGNSNLGHLRLQGQDFLSNLQDPGDLTIAGTNVLNVRINPLNFVGTRLALFARLYDKYIFKRLRFHFQPGNSTLTDGALILAYDRDVSDDLPPQSPVGVREYLSMMGSKTTQVWKNLTLDCPLSDTQDFYYTDEHGSLNDDRLVYQGRFLMAVMQSITNNLSGSVWIEYDIMLMDPHLEEAAVSVDLGYGHYNISYPAEVTFDDVGQDTQYAVLLDKYVDLSPIYYKNMVNGPDIIDRSGPPPADPTHLYVPEGDWLIFVMYGRSVQTGELPLVAMSAEAVNPQYQDSILASVYFGAVCDITRYAWTTFAIKAPPGGARCYFGFNGTPTQDVAIQPNPSSSTGTVNVALSVFQIANMQDFAQSVIDTDLSLVPAEARATLKSTLTSGKFEVKQSPKIARKFSEKLIKLRKSKDGLK